MALSSEVKVGLFAILGASVLTTTAVVLGGILLLLKNSIFIQSLAMSEVLRKELRSAPLEYKLVKSLQSKYCKMVPE